MVYAKVAVLVAELVVMWADVLAGERVDEWVAR